MAEKQIQSALISVYSKEGIQPIAERLHALGVRLYSTGGTQRYLIDNGVACERVNKVLEGRPHVVDAMTNGDIQLVVNTTEGAAALADSKSLRRAALQLRIPYYTTISGAQAAILGIAACSSGTLDVSPLQDYVSRAG